MGDFNIQEERTSRQDRRCELCGGEIAKGERYLINKGVHDGDFFESKECLDCQPIVHEYLCWADENEYSEDLIQDWWRGWKCPECEKYFNAPCEPDKNCKASKDECPYLTAQETCKAADTCDEMTHYCRCESFEKTNKG